MKILKGIFVIGILLFILFPTGTMGAKTRLGTGWINYDLVIYKEMNGTQFITGSGETVKTTSNDNISFWIENIRIETSEAAEQYIIELYVTNSSDKLFNKTFYETLEEISYDDVYSSGYGLGWVRLPAGNYTFTVSITDGKEAQYLSKNLTVIFSPISDVLLLDSDSDFIADNIDECPKIPGDINNIGCPSTTPTTISTTTSTTSTFIHPPTTTTTIPLDPSLDTGIFDKITNGITNVACRLFRLWC